MPSQNLLAAVGSSFFELGPWRLVHWYLAAVVVGSAVWVRFGGQHRRLWADHDLVWLLWHWFTGGPLEVGKSKPSESVARRATVGVARSAVPAAAVVTEYVRSGSPHGTGGTLVVVAAAGTAALTAATLAIVHAACRVAHYYQWVRPLHDAIWKHACWEENKRPWRYLKVGRNFADYDGGIWRKIATRVPLLQRLGIGRGGVIVKVAPKFNHADSTNGEGKPRQIIEDNTRKILALTDVTATWNPAGRHNYMQLRPNKPMPSVVPYAEVSDLILNTSGSAPLFGLTRGGDPVYIDIDSDSPHLLLSTGTGGGKSWTLHMIAAQLMAHGAQVAVLDHKRMSHRWIRYLEGDGVLHYAYEMEDIHNGLVHLGEVVQQRYRAWDGVDIDDVGAPKHPRLVIICEELNATMHHLKSYWRMIRPRGNTDMLGPAVRALQSTLYIGRQARTHIFGVAQMAIANDVGGPAARENFAVRMFVKTWSKNNWGAVVPHLDFRAPTGLDGRGFVCVGDRAIETQFVKMTPHEARQLVMDHRDVRVALDRVGVVADIASPGDEPGHVGVAGHLGPDVALVTLWKASTDKGNGIVPMKYDALSKARSRDKAKGLFPEPVIDDPSRPMFDARDLRRWFELKTGRRTAIDVDETSIHELDEVDDMDDTTGGTEGPERTRVGTT